MSSEIVPDPIEYPTSYEPAQSHEFDLQQELLRNMTVSMTAIAEVERGVLQAEDPELRVAASSLFRTPMGARTITSPDLPHHTVTYTRIQEDPAGEVSEEVTVKKLPQRPDYDSLETTEDIEKARRDYKERKAAADMYKWSDDGGLEIVGRDGQPRPITVDTPPMELLKDADMLRTAARDVAIERDRYDIVQYLSI